MAGVYAIQSTFVIAMSFNIKGLFKQRFYEQAYMSISLIIYQLFVAYLIFQNDLSQLIPFTKPVNDWIADFFKVSWPQLGCRIRRQNSAHHHGSADFEHGSLSFGRKGHHQLFQLKRKGHCIAFFKESSIQITLS